MKTIPLRAVQFLLIPSFFSPLFFPTILNFHVFVMSFLVAKSRISHISRIILSDLHVFLSLSSFCPSGLLFFFYRSLLSFPELLLVSLPCPFRRSLVKFFFVCHVGFNVSLHSFYIDCNDEKQLDSASVE